MSIILNKNNYEEWEVFDFDSEGFDSVEDAIEEKEEIIDLKKVSSDILFQELENRAEEKKIKNLEAKLRRKIRRKKDTE